ncbi:MAG TPA: NADPH:quinone reductase [Chthoniobacteraceae bacterium]|nr:NADPH:quinone reductase [Chthoniobacteraceae bacterium]
MKAIRVKEFGAPEVLRVEEIDDLKPGEDEVLVKVEAAGINPVETYIRSGNYPRLPQLPYTPGNDGAGTVEAVGRGVSGVKTGDRVFLTGSTTGTYAEYCVCTKAQVHALPDGLSFAQGAAVGVPYATAHRALFDRGGGKRGETVLIHGGTGGVGTAAVQLAVAAGLRVFATGGTPTGRVLLQENGASEVFDHHEVGYLEAIRTATEGRGVNLIVEMLANINLGNDLTVLAPGGRVVVVGSRGPVEINPRDLMSREADVRGLMLFAAPPEELAKVYADLKGKFASGSAVPIVAKEFPLSEAAAAHTAVMTAGAHGKIVLVPGLKAAEV